jgi:hypothetical protein
MVSQEQQEYREAFLSIHGGDTPVKHKKPRRRPQIVAVLGQVNYPIARFRAADAYKKAS